MPKLVAPMSAKAVGALKHNGKGEKTVVPVGGVAGLYIVIYATGAKAWQLRATFRGARREFGLGSYSDVNLGRAREAALQFKKKLADGIDPSQPDEVKEVKRIKFSQALDLFCETELNQVKTKERKAWLSTLRTYAVPVFGKRDVDTITTLDVSKALKPIWGSKPEIAKKVRMRLDKIFVWLRATGYREDQSPAKWEDLKPILSPLGRTNAVQHRPAVYFKDIPRWFSLVRSKKCMSARALEFLCLTAVRSGDVRYLTWDEINYEEAVWTILPNREGTKLKTRPHQVPLTESMLSLLHDVKRESRSKYVFASVQGRPMSDSTISKIMREMHAEELAAGRTGFLDFQTGARAVPHGLRSSFRDWVAECTTYSGELAEIAIAHKSGSDTELAYKRMSQVEKRRQMMEDWGKFVLGRRVTEQALDRNKELALASIGL